MNAWYLCDQLLSPSYFLPSEKKEKKKRGKKRKRERYTGFTPISASRSLIAAGRRKKRKKKRKRKNERGGKKLRRSRNHSLNCNIGVSADQLFDWKRGGKRGKERRAIDGAHISYFSSLGGKKRRGDRVAAGYSPWLMAIKEKKREEGRGSGNLVASISGVLAPTKLLVG